MALMIITYICKNCNNHSSYNYVYIYFFSFCIYGLANVALNGE